LRNFTFDKVGEPPFASWTRPCYQSASWYVVASTELSVALRTPVTTALQTKEAGYDREPEKSTWLSVVAEGMVVSRFRCNFKLTNK